MRTTADLVSELCDAPDGERVDALVVGFEGHSEFVFSDDPNPLATLNEAVRRGGEPIGMVRWNGQEVSARPLAEFADEEWVDRYLITLLADIGRVFQARGVDLGPTYEEG